MSRKSNIRIVGEVLTFVSNILITLSIVIGMIYLYFLRPILNTVPETDYYYTGINMIDNFISLLNNNMALFLSIGLTIIILIWMLREIVIRSRGIVLIIIAIIFNISNLIALIGYALILYDNIQPKINTSSYDEEIDRPKSKSIIYTLVVTLIVGVVILFSTVIIIFKDSPNGEIITNKFEEIQNHTPESIKLDYENKKIQAEQVLTKENGIVRYYDILINQLRQYYVNDTNNIENAKTVYDLSDELLNNMYQDFKNNMSEDGFNKLREEQRVWVKDKLITEENLQNDEITKYKVLIEIILDRCSEWNN